MSMMYCPGCDHLIDTDDEPGGWGESGNEEFLCERCREEITEKEHNMLYNFGDPKFQISVVSLTVGERAVPAARIVNRETGTPIPDDEPIFILRGKDVLAGPTIQHYMELAEEHSHAHALSVAERLEEFARFGQEHPERMKVPD